MDRPPLPGALDEQRQVRRRQASAVDIAVGTLAHYGSFAAWLSLVAATLGALAVLPALESYTWTWIELGLIVLGFKSIVLSRAPTRRVQQLGVGQLLGFVFAWPGMRLEPFFIAAERSEPRPLHDPLVRSYLTSGVLNIAAGVALCGLLYWQAVRLRPDVEGLFGLASLALVMLFGFFDLLAAGWRWLGVPVHKQWDFPLASRSLAEYWSVRWNRAFHDFAREQIYLPLRKSFNSTVVLFVSFVFSGVMHDLVISAPARGGYGRPTLYFVLQAIGIWAERKWIPAGLARRLWVWIVLLLPMPLLLHRPFMDHVVLPQIAVLLGKSH